jgi:cell division protein FtsN
LGLVLGSIVATLVYVYAPDPTTTSARSVTPKPSGSPRQVSGEAAQHRPASPPKPAEKPPEPQYDFYTLLPEMEVPVPLEPPDPRKEALQLKPKQAPPTGPLRREERAKAQEPSRQEQRKAPSRPSGGGTGGGSYVLQAGSFSDPEPADRLKARLALLGLVSKIQQVGLGSNQVRYRVHVGPFRDLAQVDKVRSQLKAHRIDAIVLKTSSGR